MDNTYFVTYVGVLLTVLIIIPSLVLATPAAIRERSWKRFFSTLARSFFGIVLPILTFLTSAALVPESQEGSHYDWVRCFHLGKLALTPLVLWACTAFYVSQIRKPADGHRAWVVLGLFTGGIISAICLVFGIGTIQERELFPWLIVPLYVAAWYLILYVHISRNVDIGISSYVVTWLGSLPFWAASLILSKQYYLTLPEYQPKCFVVTAALRGHQELVGPFTKINRNGAIRLVNLQLLTFWQFEDIWRDRSPRTHRIFRSIYNRVGPFIASRVKTRLAADIIYLTLKPFEWIAAIICNRYGAEKNQVLHCDCSRK